MPTIAEDPVMLCIGCGRDITDLAPGEEKYQGFVYASDSPWHVSCLQEAEMAIERGLEAIRMMETS